MSGVVLRQACAHDAAEVIPGASRDITDEEFLAATETEQAVTVDHGHLGQLA
jgi:hypothetical protein